MQKFNPTSVGSAIASGLLACTTLAGIVGLASATTFPGDNIIRVAVPTPPGSPPDVISRLIANEISESNGWKFVIENRPGALQTIAMADVLKQPANGLSIFPMSMGAIAVPTLMPEKNLKLETDFAPVAEIAAGQIVVVVHPSVPAKSIAELVALMKAQPNKMNIASSAIATPGNLAGELFKLRMGVTAPQVIYPQAAQRIADLLNGTAQVAFINTVIAVEHIASGKLRALAVTGSKRIPVLKDVPTMTEQGFSQIAMVDWQGFVVKHGSPPEAIARLNGAVNKALKNPKIRTTIENLGYDVSGGSPEAFGTFIASQSRYWSKVVLDAGITLPK